MKSTLKLTTADRRALSLPRSIRARNVKFDAMTPANKRRAIALDALNRANTGQIKPSSGDWVTISTRGYKKVAKDGSDLQKLLDMANGPTCKCCALGGAICGLAAWQDRLSASEDYGEHEICVTYDNARSHLLSVFGMNQLILIENTFERGFGSLNTSVLCDNKCIRSTTFYHRHRSKRALYIAIFTSIVNHPDGLFIP